MIGLAAGLLVMTVELAVIPDKRDELVAATVELAPQVRAMAGNRSFDVLVDEKRPDVVIYLERWDSAEQQAKFYEWWVAKGMTEKLRPFVTAAPKVTTFKSAD